MMQTKILIVLPNLNLGGAERASINFFNNFNKCKYNLKIVVFDVQGPLGRFISDHIKVINLNSKSASNSFLPLFREVIHFKPDYVFTTHHRTTVVLSFIKLLMYKHFKLITRVPSNPSEEIIYGEYGYFIKQVFSLSYKFADIVVAQTDQMKNDVMTTFGVNRKRIKVIHNRVDEVFIAKSIDTKYRLYDNDKIVAVASGRIRNEKGFDVLVRALPKVVNKYSNFHLYILGDDRGCKDHILHLIDTFNLDKFVTLLGFIENPYQYYNDCDMFILSSRWEGFPNALLENFYLNTPLVSTRCVEIVEELIVDGVNGFLCPVDDADRLAESIINCVGLNRNAISNKMPQISMLEDCFE